ncbi:MAG: pilus assembly protein [Lentisphaeria bacterium]|nr:pilus assembly protein [Lentisphaeria bacterium]
MKINSRQKNRQAGASMVETMIALMVICFIFFATLQIFQWAMARMFCNYAAFYAGKAHSLGYARSFQEKAANIAAIPISGKDEYNILDNDRKTLENDLRLYMSTRYPKVDFSYWPKSYNHSKGDTYLDVSVNSQTNVATVTLRNAPYISQEFTENARAKDLFSNYNRFYGDNPLANPKGKIRTVDHAKEWLE